MNQADDLIALVQANEGKPLKLYVYNVDVDSVREVSAYLVHIYYFCRLRLPRIRPGEARDAWDVILVMDISIGSLHLLIDRSPYEKYRLLLSHKSIFLLPFLLGYLN